MSLCIDNHTSQQAGEILLAGESPHIRLHAFVERGMLCKITLEPSNAFELQVHSSDDDAKEIEGLLLNWLVHYSNKTPLPLDGIPLETPPGFYGKALEVLIEIPFGTTLTYQEVAALAGNPKAARAAGSACRTNQFPILIPCHRVLPKNGGCGNFAYGSAMKDYLLKFESPD